jgi:hypothetical protein
LSISQNSSLKTGWEVRLNFQIGLHIKDLDLLKLFKLYFGVGLVFTRGSMVYFRVRSIKDLHIIFNHFKNYPLKTQKGADFLLFVKALELIQLKMHLERTGLEQLVAIKASMNFGLSEHLKNAFPNIRAAKRANIIIGKIEPQ